MNRYPKLRAWFLGLLNASIKSGCKLGIVVISAYATGFHLDLRTLALSFSVGIIWGSFEYMEVNPIPDDDEIDVRHLPTDSTTTITTTKKDTP